MPDMQWIMFSKHRTLQAKSCIVSLVSLSDANPQDITVLYVDSGTISYDALRKEFPCRFIKQGDFYRDVMDVVRGTSKRLIGFIVDDLIFRERFDCRRIEGLMRNRGDLDCFSLRLGRHIKDGMPPAFEEPEKGILAWETASGPGRTWNYFWELSSSIYRKETVLDYLNRCSPREISFPNPMESLYYRKMPNFITASEGLLNILIYPRCLLWPLFYRKEMAKRIACYEKSRAFTQGINLVAERGLGYDTYMTTEKLHELFLQGYRIDFECLKDVKNEKPNVGRRYFRLLGPDGKRHPSSIY